MTFMAESALRRQKQKSRSAYWSTLSPEKRLRRAAQMTAAGRKLRDAGLAFLGASLVRENAPRSRKK
jgi:hypothetical protein